MLQQFRCGQCGKRFADIDIITGWIKVAGAHHNKGKKCTTVNELTFKDGVLVEHRCEMLPSLILCRPEYIETARRILKHGHSGE